MRGRGKTESVDTWMTSNWSAGVSFGSNLLEQNVKEKHVYVHIYVAVPRRKRRLFCRVFRLHHCVRSAISLNFRLGRGSYALRSCMNILWIYEAHMSPALNGSSAIQCFEGSDAIEIRNGITFDFYTELPHMYMYMCCLLLSNKYKGLSRLHCKYIHWRVSLKLWICYQTHKCSASLAGYKGRAEKQQKEKLQS